jgi:ribosomal 50S subunit-recycling heat shock protein
MRVDVYLKLARLVKRRTVAQEMIRLGAVRVDGRPVKPSGEVRKGARLAVAFPRRLLVVEVLCDDEQLLRRGGEPYLVVEERPLDGVTSPW